MPSTSIDQAQSVQVASALCAEHDDHASLLETLHRQAGIENRHVVYKTEELHCLATGTNGCDSPFLPRFQGDTGPSTGQRMDRYNREAMPLALEASRAALSRSQVAPEAVTHLVTVSCTGFAAPGVDIGLIKALGLNAAVARTNVGFMGCHGSFNALRVARGLLAAEPDGCVLLCAVELCSLHYFYGWNPKRMVGNLLFADGSAAAVLSVARDRLFWQLAASGACLFPDSEQAMSWHIRDHGFDMTLSTKVPGLIQRNLRPWLDQWLESHGHTLESIGSWAVHPGGPRVLSNVQEAIGLPESSLDPSREILRQFGNMSSATVLFILERLRAQEAPRPCVALGFGPGLCVEAALFE